jgi:hypothetical protein
VIRPPRGWPNRVFDLFSAPHVVSGRAYGIDRDRRSISPATESRRTSSEIENHYRKGLRHSTRPLRAFSRLAPAWSALRWLRSKNVIDGRSGGNRRSASAPDETRKAQRPPRPLITCSALCCRPDPRVKSLVRIGVSKTGFTGFSTPARGQDEKSRR